MKCKNADSEKRPWWTCNRRIIAGASISLIAALAVAFLVSTQIGWEMGVQMYGATFSALIFGKVAG